MKHGRGEHVNGLFGSSIDWLSKFFFPKIISTSNVEGNVFEFDYTEGVVRSNITAGEGCLEGSMGLKNY